MASTNVPYVVVVVREGYNANTISYPAITDDLYNPTMDVLISGILTDGGVEDHKYNVPGASSKATEFASSFMAGEASTVLVAFEMNFTVLT